MLKWCFTLVLHHLLDAFQQVLFFPYALGSRLRSQWKCCVRQLRQRVCLKTSSFKFREESSPYLCHTHTHPHTFFYIIDPMWVCSAGAAARFRTGGINRADFCFLQDSHICLFRSTVSVSVSVLSCSCLCSELGRAHLPYQVTAVDAEDTFSPKLVQMMKHFCLIYRTVFILKSLFSLCSIRLHDELFSNWRRFQYYVHY